MTTPSPLPHGKALSPYAVGRFWGVARRPYARGAPLFTWDGPQEDFRLRKLGFLSSVNDVAHHSKFTAATKLQNRRRQQGTPHKITLLAYLSILLN